MTTRRSDRSIHCGHIPQHGSAGEVDGARVLSPHSVERARTEQANDPTPCSSACRPGTGSAFTATPGTGFGSSGAAASGCTGAQGSIGFADPDTHIGFGYTMNQVQAGIPVNPRALRVIDALYAPL